MKPLLLSTILIQVICAQLNIANLQNFASQNPQQLERTIVSLENPYIATLLVNSNGGLLRRESSRPIPIQFHERRLDTAFINYLQQKPFLSIKLDKLDPGKTEFTFEDLFSVPYLDDFLESELLNGNINFAEIKKVAQKDKNVMNGLMHSMKKKNSLSMKPVEEIVGQQFKPKEELRPMLRNEVDIALGSEINETNDIFKDSIIVSSPILKIKGPTHGLITSQNIKKINFPKLKIQKPIPNLRRSQFTFKLNRNKKIRFSRQASNPLFSPSNILPKGSGIEAIYQEYLNSRNLNSRTTTTTTTTTAKPITTQPPKKRKIIRTTVKPNRKHPTKGTNRMRVRKGQRTNTKVKKNVSKLIRSNRM